MISCTSLAVKLSQRSSYKSPEEKGSRYSSQKNPAVKFHRATALAALYNCTRGLLRP